MAQTKGISEKVDPYLDNSESFLLKLFNRPESEKTKTITTLLKKSDLPWAVRYHLSPQRHMLLNWYPFRKSASLFEIGAGCGALTGMFLEKLSEVTCNELSPSRAKVIENRFKNYKNLIIHSGNINEFSVKKKFDYVTLIGVLEYSAKYSKNSSPYIELLKTARNLLKPGGCLLLAIENKIGLKYLAGAPEDHLGTEFTSLENYPQNQRIRTFTRNELTSLLKESGFNKIEFYYPFPDYKIPQIVFSEAGLESIDQLTKSSITQTVDYSSEFEQLFNEVALSHLLTKEEILNKFSNSFLVDAS